MNIFKRIFGKSDGDFGLPEVSSGAPMPRPPPPSVPPTAWVSAESAIKQMHRAPPQTVIAKKDSTLELEKRVYELYPVGREFKYLELLMRVAKHRELTGYGSYIVCHYLNGQGLIKVIFFDCSEVNSWEDKPLT